MKKLFPFFIIIVFTFFSCEKSTDPNVIGGSTDIPLTKVGSSFGVSFDVGDPVLNMVVNRIEDSIVITKNENGLVNFNVTLKINEKTLRQIDTLLGTYKMPGEVLRKAITDLGFTVDNSTPNVYKFHRDVKFKITSEGIQDFFYAEGDYTKPFTMFKYSSKVGDEYTYKRKDGYVMKRKVIATHTVEDWDLGYLLIKTMRVEQQIENDPVFKKVIWVGNHKFGWVGAIAELHDGRKIQTTIFPWSMLFD